MQTLIQTLANYDSELLRVISNRWDVDLPRDPKQAVEVLAAAMLTPNKVVEMWNRLDDDQRGALQTLLGSQSGQMPLKLFTRLHGEIRPMGGEKIKTEKPHLSPVNVAEALYYRGLISQGNMKIGKSAVLQTIIYIPADLAALMPKHITGFAKEPPPPRPEPLPPATTPEPDNIRPADTSAVDDLTTFLAACQIEDVPISDEGTLASEYREPLAQFFIGPNSAPRVAMLINLALDMGLLKVENKLIKPVPQTARRWLDLPRIQQVRALAEGWQRSTRFNELFYVPGIKPERTGSWRNDPLLARQTVFNYLEMVPPSSWWQAKDLIETIQEDEPDFMRPDGDYDSWYIKDASTGKYLKGIASWPKVDGAMLHFILTGPMHGLGLLDTAANGTACRLTPYGRALVGLNEWEALPPLKNEGTPIKIGADGICRVPRATNRYERFQLARFTEWIAGVSANEPYQYRIGQDGLNRARVQHFKAEQILNFLRRISENGLPEAVVRQIELWGASEEEGASIGQMWVLRVPTAALLNTIHNTPSLRRYLGAILGDRAVAIRPNQWEALFKALREAGIAVEMDKLE
ncbi:MAG: hypothetical protein OHK0023_16920 [Anaerolineae bacterium]